MKNFKIIAIGLILTIGLTSLVVYRIKQKNETQALLKKPKINVVPVTTIKPKKDKFISTLTVSGSFLPNEEVQIIPKATGKIIYLNLEEGNQVNKGDLIAEIDHSEIDAQINQAQANVKVAEANLKLALNGPLNPQKEQAKYQIKQNKAYITQLESNKKNLEKDLSRYIILEKQGSVSTQQLDNVKTQISVLEQQINSSKQQLASSEQGLKLLEDGTRPEQIEVNKAMLESAKANVKLYQAQLENYKIIAPFDGLVSKKLLFTGSLVTQNTPILTLSKKHSPDLVMSVPEKEIFRIKKGQKVEIKVPHEKNKTLKATIKEINPAVDPVTHLFKVRGKTDNLGSFKLGMILDCLITTNEIENALILPADAVIRSDDKNIIFTTREKTKEEKEQEQKNKLDNKKQNEDKKDKKEPKEKPIIKKAVLKEVEIGLQNTNEIEILSGLDENDEVIMKGNVFVNEGDDVSIQKETK
ncbi:MAG: efflux RND transporter periplasmic adaptor subunit [Candidatus Sericytochromatia bacterium]